MKVTLANGTVIENVVNVEESFTPRSNRGTVLNIRLNSDLDVDGLRELFTEDALATITVTEGEKATEIKDYVTIDSIRKFYDSRVDYNAAVDLIHAEA